MDDQAQHRDDQPGAQAAPATPAAHSVDGVSEVATNSTGGANQSADDASAALVVRADESLLLESFLSGRDVPCPACGYNLRGSSGERCPECGRGIEIGVVGKRESGRLMLVVLLALAWAMFAAGINAARAGKVVVDQAAYAAQTSARSQVMYFSSSSSFTINGRQSGGGGTTNIVVKTNPDGSVTKTITDGAGKVTVTTQLPNGTVINGVPTAVANAAPPPRYLWTGVPRMQWVWLGFWGGISLLGMAGLMVGWGLSRRKKREWGPEVTKVMVTWATLVFGVYAGYHVVTFINEVSTW